jgi:hypothetical protein
MPLQDFTGYMKRPVTCGIAMTEPQPEAAGLPQLVGRSSGCLIGQNSGNHGIATEQERIESRFPSKLSLSGHQKLFS